MTSRARYPSLALGAAILAILLVALAAIRGEQAAAQDEMQEEMQEETQTLDEEHQFGDVVAQIYSVSEADGATSQRLVLLRSGVEVARVEDYLVSLRCISCEIDGQDHMRVATPRPGENITGQTGHQLAIHQYSGGASCCEGLTILSLEPDIEVLASVTGGYPAYLVQMDDDPALEIVTFDPAYWDWHALSRADRVAPQVVLKFDPASRKYAFAEAIMRAPPPDAAALAARARRWKADPDWKVTLADGVHAVPNGLRDAVLELAYSGNLRAAIALLHATWPDGMEEARDDFLADLQECRLRASNYWPGIARINALEAEPAPEHCPER
ncbi:MAG: hypothetical protein FJX21_06680 [Alphaproteobacteria bacterium]|nr:hypothetical protein [Alphaproteobacteria bacterium]